MDEIIQLREDVLTSRISHVERAIKNIDNYLQVNESIDYTNIKPYVNDLENMLKMVQILTKYLPGIVHPQ